VPPSRRLRRQSISLFCTALSAAAMPVDQLLLCQCLPVAPAGNACVWMFAVHACVAAAAPVHHSVGRCDASRSASSAPVSPLVNGGSVPAVTAAVRACMLASHHRLTDIHTLSLCVYCRAKALELPAGGAASGGAQVACPLHLTAHCPAWLERHGVVAEGTRLDLHPLEVSQCWAWAGRQPPAAVFVMRLLLQPFHEACGISCGKRLMV